MHWNTDTERETPSSRKYIFEWKFSHRCGESNPNPLDCQSSLLTTTPQRICQTFIANWTFKPDVIILLIPLSSIFSSVAYIIKDYNINSRLWLTFLVQHNQHVGLLLGWFVFIQKLDLDERLPLQVQREHTGTGGLDLR